MRLRLGSQRHRRPTAGIYGGTADWLDPDNDVTIPAQTTPHGGSDLTELAPSPTAADLDTSSWTWGGTVPILDVSAQQIYDIMTQTAFDPPAIGTDTGLVPIADDGLVRGLQYQLRATDEGDYENVYINVTLNGVNSPTIFGLVPPDDYSYSAPDNSGPVTPANPPTDPLPIVSRMEYENVVPDTNLDDVVQVDHDQTTFGQDTGSMGFEPQRDMPQVYIPLNTDGLDTVSTGLPIHEYLVQGGFGTASNAVGNLGTNAWTFADADENGQPYAYSLDTRVDVNLVMNDDNGNHIKRIEVVRPRGNTVVFDFAWDAGTQSFSQTGYPMGINAERLYVLRALDPADDSSLSYELLFPSGIVQTFGGFNGGLMSVSDANTGLSASMPSVFGPGDTGDAGSG